MRISTRSLRENQGGGNAPSARRRVPGREKASRKNGKSRITGRRILSAVRMLGKLGGILIIAVLVLSLSIYAFNSEKFQVRDIAIYGCKNVDPAKLERIVRDTIPDNILRIDLGLLKEKLEQEIWIKQVEIRRVLPSGLVIIVQERIQAVILEMQGQLMIADHDGILLDRYLPKYGKLDVPVFKGVEGKDAASYLSYQEENTERIRHALNMLAEIESGSPQYSRMISEIDISDQNNLKVILVDDNAEIYLGKEDYLNRLHVLLTNEKYKELRKQNKNIVVVDLRIENQIRYEQSGNVSVTRGKESK